MYSPEYMCFVHVFYTCIWYTHVLRVHCNYKRFDRGNKALQKNNCKWKMYAQKFNREREKPARINSQMTTYYFSIPWGKQEIIRPLYELTKRRLEISDWSCDLSFIISRYTTSLTRRNQRKFFPNARTDINWFNIQNALFLNSETNLGNNTIIK